MRNIVLWLLVAMTVLPIGARAQTWTVAGIDALRDGRDPSRPDAAQLSYRYDKEQDVLWFRVSLYNAPNATSVRVMFIVDSAADKPVIRDAHREGTAVV